MADDVRTDDMERPRLALEEVRQMVREADADLEAGRVGPFDREQTKREVRERLRQQKLT